MNQGNTLTVYWKRFDHPTIKCHVPCPDPEVFEVLKNEGDLIFFDYSKFKQSLCLAIGAAVYGVVNQRPIQVKLRMLKDAILKEESK